MFGRRITTTTETDKTHAHQPIYPLIMDGKKRRNKKKKGINPFETNCTVHLAVENADQMTRRM